MSLSRSGAPPMTGTRSLDVATARTLGANAQAWDDLVARQPLPSPFLRSWWVENASARQPLFVLVFEDGRLVGGLALEEDTRLPVPRYLAAGNLLGPDHVDLVAEPSYEDAVAAAAAGWFRSGGGRMIDFGLAPEHGRLGPALGAAVEVVEAAPYTALDGDFASFLRARPSQLRNSHDRARRRLTKEGVEYVKARPEEVDRSIGALGALHLEVFGSDGSLFLPHFDRFALVARAGVAAGEVVFHQLRHDDDIIATVVTFELGGRVSYYQAGRRTDHRWRGSGAVIEAHLLEDAFRRGMTEFDHLRGTEPYKVAWAPQLRPLTRVTATHGASGRAASAAITAAKRGVAWVRAARAGRDGGDDGNGDQRP